MNHDFKKTLYNIASYTNIGGAIAIGAGGMELHMTNGDSGLEILIGGLIVSGASIAYGAICGAKKDDYKSPPSQGKNNS